MAAIKAINSAMLELSCTQGVDSVTSCDEVPNLLIVDYDPFPHAVNVLVGMDELYILPSECESLAHDLTIYEIKEGLTALNIKILEL